MHKLFLGLVFVAGSISSSFAAEAAQPALGRKLVDFSLKDFRGRSCSLSDYESTPLVVIAVLGTECPLAKQYAVKLQKLADIYVDRGVVFLAIDANRQDSLTEIASFAQVNSLTYPILKDLNQQVVSALQATPMISRPSRTSAAACTSMRLA